MPVDPLGKIHAPWAGTRLSYVVSTFENIGIPTCYHTKQLLSEAFT